MAQCKLSNLHYVDTHILVDKSLIYLGTIILELLFAKMTLFEEDGLSGVLVRITGPEDWA